jgi:ABC-type uncharacterized transport system substrate-binding protein
MHLFNKKESSIIIKIVLNNTERKSLIAKCEDVINYLFCITCPVLKAHPHVWVDIFLDFEFNNSKELTAITQEWTFSDMFSSVYIKDFDNNDDGKFTIEESEKIMKELQIIHKNGQPYGIRDKGGFLLFFPKVSKYDGQDRGHKCMCVRVCVMHACTK